MKCVVTGATGFIGSALSAQLEQAGLVVERCGREAPADDQLQGARILYHCAGIAHRAASEADYEAFNFRASLELAARAEAAGIRRFVFLSSVNAEDTGEPYGYWKQRTEQALLEAHDGQAMSVVMVRPALVYGPGARANLQRLIQLVRYRMPAPPAGEPRSMIGLPDLCDALSALTDVEPGHGSVLTATDGEAYTLSRMHAAIARALDREPGTARLPLWAWRLACLMFDTLRGKPGSGRTFERLFSGTLYSNESLRTALSWQPRYRFEDLVPAMLAAEEGA